MSFLPTAFKTERSNHLTVEPFKPLWNQSLCSTLANSGLLSPWIHDFCLACPVSEVTSCVNLWICIAVFVSSLLIWTYPSHVFVWMFKQPVWSHRVGWEQSLSLGSVQLPALVLSFSSLHSGAPGWYMWGWGSLDVLLKDWHLASSTRAPRFSTI